MKVSLKKAALLCALVCTPALLQAQSSTPTVEYGRTTLQLNPGFVDSLPGMGASLTDLHGNPLQNCSITFQETSGAIDLTTAAGEIEHTGGFVIMAAGATIRIENLIIDTTNPAAMVITAQVIVNDHFVGRMPLFNVLPPSGLTLPLQPQAGVLQVSGMSITLAPAAASAINGVFGGPVVQAGTQMGTANFYAVLAPAN